MKRTIVFTIAVLAGFVFGAGAVFAEPEKSNSANRNPEISLLLSNGQKFSGKIVRVNKKRVFIRCKNKSGGGKTSSVFKANIAEIFPLSLELPLPLPLPAVSSDEKIDGENNEKNNEEDEDDEKNDPCNAAKSMAAGGEFLKLNRPELADIAFNIAIQRDAKLGGAIGKIYAAAGKEIPKKFGEPAPLRLFVLPTPTQIKNCTEKASRWGKKMKKIAPKTHTIETKHFIIYSAWSRSNDKKLASIYERLYRTLCKQFNIPKEHNIWIGKFPVFAFWKRHNFTNFCADVVGIPTFRTDRAAGFMGQNGEYRFVVLGPVKNGNMSKTSARNWFFELLVHESTHAFLSRYVSSIHVVSWLNEGIAETITADLLPESRAALYLRKIHTNLKGIRNDEFMLFFEARNIPMNAESYGTAQSLVRFLVKNGKKKFIRMIQEIKRGSTDAQALKSVYGMTYQSLLNKWKRKIR